MTTLKTNLTREIKKDFSNELSRLASKQGNAYIIANGSGEKGMGADPLPVDAIQCLIKRERCGSTTGPPPRLLLSGQWHTSK